MNKFRQFLILILLSGFLDITMYPNHNEPIDSMGYIAKWKVELGQNLDLGRLRFTWNPVVWADGIWPEQSRILNPDRWYLENHLKLSIRITDNLSIYGDKINFYNIHNPKNLYFWDSYGNGFGIRYNW